MKGRIEIGTIKSSMELGRKGRALCIWDACPVCGIERWIRKNASGKPCRICIVKSRHYTLKSQSHASTVWIQEEPRVGDIAVASQIGRRGKGYYTWSLCPDCGKGRWIQNRSYSMTSPCFSCANKRRLMGSRNPRWNGGVRYSPGHGYYVRVDSNHPLYNMSISAGGQKYIAEHRLIMALHLGRSLEPWEIVHHINGDNTDNRLENLELLPSRANHLPLNILQSQLHELQKRVTLLEAENALLKSMLEGKPIPSQAEGSQSPSGVCRDLTGDILNNKDEEKVHTHKKL